MCLASAQAACLGSSLGNVDAVALAKRRFVREAGAQLSVVGHRRRMRSGCRVGKLAAFSEVRVRKFGTLTSACSRWSRSSRSVQSTARANRAHC